MKRSQRLLLKLWTSESEIPRRREQVFLERRTRVVYRTTIFFFPPLWISNGIFRTMSNRVEKVVYWLRPKLSTDLQRNISCTINTVTKLLLLENRSSVWPWCTTTSLLLKVKRRKFRKDLRKSILHVEKDSDSFLFSATKHICIYVRHIHQWRSRYSFAIRFTWKWNTEMESKRRLDTRQTAIVQRAMAARQGENENGRCISSVFDE